MRVPKPGKTLTTEEREQKLIFLLRGANWSRVQFGSVNIIINDWWIDRIDVTEMTKS